MNRYLPLLREALASIRSQPVASALTVVMVAGLCTAVLLTTGRTVAAEQAVLAELDNAGTRSIIVRAEIEAGVGTGLLDQLQAVEGVDAVAGFGPIVDARNAAIPGGPRVPVRRGYGTVGDHLLSRTLLPGTRDETALASAEGRRAAGIPEGSGGLRDDNGKGFVVVGRLDVPAHLRFLEPLVVIPSSTPEGLAGPDPSAPIAVMVVLARTPPEVAAVAAVVRGLLPPPDGSTVSVETSAQLAAIRAAIGGELGTYGRATVVGIVAVSSILVAINLLGLVAMRRKDFGRRRALGARRSLIVQLLLAQVAMLAMTGAVVGTAASIAWLAGSDGRVPNLSYVLAVAVTGILTALLGAITPAVVAARRDPLHELRVP